MQSGNCDTGRHNKLIIYFILWGLKYFYYLFRAAISVQMLMPARDASKRQTQPLHCWKSEIQASDTTTKLVPCHVTPGWEIKILSDLQVFHFCFGGNSSYSKAVQLLSHISEVFGLIFVICRPLTRTMDANSTVLTSP